MRLNLSSVCAFVGSILWLTASQAGATTITTSSFNAWKTSYITGASTALNFYPVNSVTYNTAAGITLSPNGSSLPFVFTGPDNGSYNLTGDGYSKALLGSADAGAAINIALPSGGENALFVAVNATAIKPASVLLSNGESYSVNSTFFGVALSQPVSWMRISTVPGSQVYINDFLYGASALPQDVLGGISTPEPATLFLSLSGFGMVFFGMWRKRTI